ncbi:BZ3500_MvSof-1268-A1-R1_Chr5-2g07767 [Microbotryum saponariae]|uniref:BZ3500_MvSof-1268-A1-R1_Chr5-2g07767 protein n=1 Tax=Microbotryum saponariae TaxID=289078 RepID=A0A2X0NIS8_9BASI|nr:BZ3500_MvSof-1268-A1-R1_Chr5-2g07767 [Microbotryum saponariae]SDA05636.1 BZ3501_MvSof-1269-A2-R1_Chr5-2g07589 [Microbotryum saponariae]
MYSCFGAPEDRNTKKQAAAGAANANACESTVAKGELATNDQVSGRRVLLSAHPPLLISGVFRNGQTGFGKREETTEEVKGVHSRRSCHWIKYVL